MSLRLSHHDMVCELRPDLGGCVAGLWLGGIPILRSTPGDQLHSVRASGCYPLVPFSNRIAQAKLVWNGTSHPLVRNFNDEPHAIHGVGWQRPWTVLDQTDNTALLSYEPDVMQSFLVRAKQRGCSALEALYDYFSAGDGDGLVYFPIFNYNQGSLDTVRQMLTHPRALFGLGDAGAHVGTICDASFSTFMLSHWVLGRVHDRLPLAQAVEMMSLRNARYLGLTDRGRLAPGLRADLNVIDPTRLRPNLPQLVRDLPAGGKRFLQTAQGYVGTWVAGQAVAREGVVTTARPGRLVRLGVRETAV